MFLTAKPQTIEDFLKAINFIAPQGYTLEYFIAPQDGSNENNYVAPNNTGFVGAPSESIVPGVTDTVVYTKKDLNDTHSFSADPFDLNQVPNAMPKNAPTTTQNPLIGTGQSTLVMTPVKLDRRVGSNTQDVQIKESFMGFPKFTLFHFTKD